MKVYGDLTLNESGANTEHKIQAFGLGLLPEFPDVPRLGNIVFKDKKVYIYCTLNTLGVWLPLTSEIVSYSALFTDINPWICVHHLDSAETVLQIYDTENRMLIPDRIDQSVSGRTIITFSQNMSGRIFIVQRLANTDRQSVYLAGYGGELLVDGSGNYIAGA